MQRHPAPVEGRADEEDQERAGEEDRHGGDHQGPVDHREGQGDPTFAWQWISDWLEDGTLAAAAWSGFQRLPKFGAYRILEAMGLPAEGLAAGSGFPPGAAAATMPR